MAVFANDLIGTSINQHGFYESAQLDLLMQFLSSFWPEFKNGVCLDIGANIGNHSVFFSRYFNKIIAFEPNPITFSLLEINLNWAKNAHSHNVGLSDSEADLFISEDITNAGGAWLSHTQAPNSTGNKVKVVTLDSLEFNTGICLIKIDVEGFERAVLDGARLTLTENQPIVVLEQHGQEFLEGSTPALEVLESLGYSFFWQEQRFQPSSWLACRGLNLWELINGRQDLIVTGPKVPARDHSMICAIPTSRMASLANI